MPQMTDVGVGPVPGPVSVVRCDDYEFEALRAALTEVLAPLGGMSAFVKPGERIGLKPNVLLPSSPEAAICTHPLVVAAVALAVKEAGGHPVVVESPGAGVIPLKTVMERVFRRAGYRQVADRYGFELSTEVDPQAVNLPEGKTIHRVEVIGPILRCDGIINLAKFKTHGFMIFTGATKNLFGVIPGLTKVGYHGKFADPLLFGGMLLDVASYVKPRLSLVDGILAMEGKGPGTGGTPRHLGLLLAGTDTVAIDAVCCRIAGVDTSAVPVLAVARERGLWGGRAADVHSVGVPVAELVLKDFVMPIKNVGATESGETGFFGGMARSLLRNGFSPRPRPQVGPCTICGSCEQACPGQAIAMDKKARVARVDDDKCIRCYCCHEVCPNAAIELQFTGMGRLVHGFKLV
jgi:uncharacterized protein (DUF362 family)/Pyruvate/2-oxoacid:ferredoxin oxidoreductase delta subunit